MRGFLRQDVNFSIRTLVKNLGFTITAVLTLALGIGATTAIFSVVYAVFEPMPYPKPDQLVMVWSKIQGERTVGCAWRLSGMEAQEHILPGSECMVGRLIQRSNAGAARTGRWFTSHTGVFQNGGLTAPAWSRLSS